MVYFQYTGYFLNSRADDVAGTIQAAYSTYAGSATDIVAGTNNSANAGTLVARNTAGNVFFADLIATPNEWKQADGSNSIPFDITDTVVPVGITIYDKYIDGTTLRSDGVAISVNGALADAPGNAAPVPGGSGIITSIFNVATSTSPASIDYT
ncbi:hypothetical protein FACS1894181_17520 [Bacteroidia bacterium]|nr:hypothetical protein FACS1894181_17520 [Bacteroidia bacterium]